MAKFTYKLEVEIPDHIVEEWNKTNAKANANHGCYWTDLVGDYPGSLKRIQEKNWFAQTIGEVCIERRIGNYIYEDYTGDAKCNLISAE